MQDGAPPHYALIVRDYLRMAFNNQVIGRGFNIAWPARSPDLNVMDFYFWGHGKDKVYARKPNNLNELELYIEDFFSDVDRNEQQRINVINSVSDRFQLCFNQNGRQFEHLRK